MTNHIRLPTSISIIHPSASIQTQLIFNFSYNTIDVGVIQQIEIWPIIRISYLWPTNELQTNPNLLLDLSPIKIRDHLNGFKLWNSSKRYSNSNLLYNIFNLKYTYSYMFYIVRFQVFDGRKDSIAGLKLTNDINLIFSSIYNGFLVPNSGVLNTFSS